ncbi:hypothetical protein [Nonomuraea rubra]|uniref:Uncharacterized protein n=2 Tax=Nonomuraea rubra TaxID=46180 RepID=A0A7X0NNV7_9ACTN|nr:hypothetical protein [Nonomuraea rubra]MBB6546877.1 hypothetical protein [Nonomuraea rubra]
MEPVAAGTRVAEDAAADVAASSRRIGGVYAERPACVYVMHHDELGAVKVGITGAKSSRLEVFRRRGWTLVGALPVASGDHAWELEQVVLRHLRQLGLTFFLSRAQVPSGRLETFNADQMPPGRLWQLVQEAPTWLAERDAQEAEAHRRARGALDAMVEMAAAEAKAAPPLAMREDLTRGQLFALFGRNGVKWHRALLIARFDDGDVRLRNGPIMLGAIAVDPATLTVTGRYRVFLIRRPFSSAYFEVPLAQGVIPADPVNERRRRLPPAGPRPVR